MQGSVVPLRPLRVEALYDLFHEGPGRRECTFVLSKSGQSGTSGFLKLEFRGSHLISVLECNTVLLSKRDTCSESNLRCQRKESRHRVSPVFPIPEHSSLERD